MLEGFQSINGNCYYLDSDSGGALEYNAWVFSQDAYAYYACSSGAIVLTGVMDSVGSIRLNDAEGKPHSRLDSYAYQCGGSLGTRCYLRR